MKLWLVLVIDFEFSYLNVVQTTCPHILRYITAAAIISKRRKNIMKELVKIIQQESYNYRDPITELVECLYVNFDFDGAQVKLRECDQVCRFRLLSPFFIFLNEWIFIKGSRKRLLFGCFSRWVHRKRSSFLIRNVLPHSSMHHN